MGIHLLRYTHGNECIGTHDVVCDIFATIVWEASFHVGWKQLHVFSLATSNSSYQQVDIVLIKYGIRTLIDIVIIDPT
jgi:hypothetical protein